MTYTPDYTIKKIGGGEVPLLFNTRTIKKFSQSQGLEIEDMLSKLKNSQIDSLLSIAHETYCVYNNKEIPSISEDEALMWIDSLGGYNGKQMNELTWVFLSAATGKTKKELEEFISLANSGEKKSTK